MMTSLQSQVPEMQQTQRKHAFRLAVFTQPAGPIPRPGRDAVLRHDSDAGTFTVRPVIIHV